MMITIFETTDNITGKGEIAGYQPFLSFQQCLKEPSSTGIAQYIGNYYFPSCQIKQTKLLSLSQYPKM